MLETPRHLRGYADGTPCASRKAKLRYGECVPNTPHKRTPRIVTHRSCHAVPPDAARLTRSVPWIPFWEIGTPRRVRCTPGEPAYGIKSVRCPIRGRSHYRALPFFLARVVVMRAIVPGRCEWSIVWKHVSAHAAFGQRANRTPQLTVSMSAAWCMLVRCRAVWQLVACAMCCNVLTMQPSPLLLLLCQPAESCSATSTCERTPPVSCQAQQQERRRASC